MPLHTTHYWVHQRWGNVSGSSAESRNPDCPTNRRLLHRTIKRRKDLISTTDMARELLVEHTVLRHRSPCATEGNSRVGPALQHPTTLQLHNHSLLSNEILVMGWSSGSHLCLINNSDWFPSLGLHHSFPMCPSDCWHQEKVLENHSHVIGALHTPSSWNV